ncbi:transcriptional regulator [Actinorhabdospora filicis]|uniref:Transcriptional regulator n=1 Tax=Actinorhabdospora filicis TaxID=1785913 RepID=A0A9W6STE9_9ACTN|nr:helix-turn-helix transcriptional regulator [Actinorhabdospora filicis]GLZ81630.1 transcriptional regulator [Actinorhabdospora filicis]
MIHGRDGELAAIGEALGRVRDGGSAALVLRGEPGAGKTALLEHAAGTAADMTVLRAAGVQVETELPYAALHQVLRPALRLSERLPAPQAAAIGAALGLAEGGAPDRFAVGLATLSLLAELAEERPVLCLVDNAQWLDRESADALTFAARRLHADRLGLLFAARDGGFPAEGLAELPVPGLDDEAAQALLAEAGLAPALRARVIAETGGNPLALRELARTAASADPAGSALPLPRRVQDAFAAEVAALPGEARTFLLIASAEDTGELGVLLRAAAALGVPATAVESCGELIEVSASAVAFRHPLVRAAVYQSAPLTERLAAHRALAGVLTDDRRAWHTAAAATGLDDDAADLLAATAERARARGGRAAAVTALVRAAELTSGTEKKAARLAAAAESAGDSGQGARARDLAERAAALATDPRVLAHVAELRGEAELLTGSPATAHRVMLAGAAAVLPVDPGRAAIMVMHIVDGCRQAGDHERAAEAVSLLDGVDLTGPAAAGLPATRGLAAIIAGRPAGAAAPIRGMVEAILPLRGGQPGLRGYAASLAFAVGDHDRAAELTGALAGECRSAGMAGWLPTVLSTLGESLLRLGRFAEARIIAAEGGRIAADTGQYRLTGHFGALAGWLAATAGEVPAETDDDALTSTVATRAWAHALADLGAGRHEAAADRWDAATRGPARHTAAALGWAPDHVEAAVRAGDPARAEAALALFAPWAEENGRPWAEAVLTRCRALLSASPEPHFERAMALHGRERRPWDEARTALLYGEWLRREKHRSRARAHLRAAAETFERLGATPWAERATTELRASGESHGPARAAEPDTWSRLTPQEAQVVRLAATGASNRDIAAQLFLSPRTVGHHLYKAYPKLGVSGRGELARLISP